MWIQEQTGKGLNFLATSTRHARTSFFFIKRDPVSALVAAHCSPTPVSMPMMCVQPQSSISILRSTPYILSKPRVSITHHPYFLDIPH